MEEERQISNAADFPLNTPGDVEVSRWKRDVCLSHCQLQAIGFSFPSLKFALAILMLPPPSVTLLNIQ